MSKCQYVIDEREDLEKRCSGILLDRTQEYIVIVHEKGGKWGIPKGHFKTQEGIMDCVHREVCEEVGVDIDQYRHQLRIKGKDKVIIFYDNVLDIPLHADGEEIDAAIWVPIDDLVDDVTLHPNKYNVYMKLALRKLFEMGGVIFTDISLTGWFRRSYPRW